MSKQHRYSSTITWTGNTGEGTGGYKKYSRDHELSVPGKSVVALSSDPTFRGDVHRMNPEELLIASISSCHMLWYLHLCSENGIVVQRYVDHAEGIMEESMDGAGAFVAATLYPEIRIQSRDNLHLAKELHHEAHGKCFIANSVNFPVKIEAKISIR